MKWVLLDNLTPNRPCLINLNNIDAINWNSGTLCFEYQGGQCTELECEKNVFVELAQALSGDIIKEID